MSQVRYAARSFPRLPAKTMMMMTKYWVLYQPAYLPMVQHTMVHQIPSCVAWKSSLSSSSSWTSSAGSQWLFVTEWFIQSDHFKYHHLNIFLRDADLLQNGWIFDGKNLIVIIISIVLNGSELVGQDCRAHFPHSIDRHNQHTPQLLSSSLSPLSSSTSLSLPGHRGC